MVFTAEQMSISTAEDELNYFSGYAQPKAQIPTGSAMPTGTYRVVDGVLWRIVNKLDEEGFTDEV